MENGKDLYDLSVNAVEESCRRYLVDKDLNGFFERTNQEDIPLVGLSTPDWEEKFQIESEHYQDIEYGIKLANTNIGFNDNIYTFPYFCTFLLKRYLKEVCKVL